MDITGLGDTTIRIGEYPVCLDVKRLPHGDWTGVYATFHVSSVADGLARVELRHKQGEYALFISRFTDAELPDWWKDSEVVWELKPDKAEGDDARN